MEPKPAAGLIIYRLQRTPEFLLFNDSYSQKRHWSPPKGFVSSTKRMKKDQYDTQGMEKKKKKKRKGEKRVQEKEKGIIDEMERKIR